MPDHTRTLRRSEAVQPYGPGAILDWGQECFAVIDTSRKNNKGWSNGKEIRLERLERQLGAHLGFRLAPTTEDRRRLGILVTRFPRWLFCPACGMMVQWWPKQESGLSGDSPKCREAKCQAKETVLVPMRSIFGRRRPVASMLLPCLSGR